MTLPPELWLCVFHYASLAPGTLVPDIYAHASLIGPVYTKTCHAAIRETLITTRALVRVCKQWWHLAIPYLYRSVYVGRARCLASLSRTLVRSATGKGTLVSTRPLGEYTQRLDIAIRDHAENPDAECVSLATLIASMPYLTVVSFAFTSNYPMSDPPSGIVDALQLSASSLCVLDWTSTQPELSGASRIAYLLPKCTQLRILNCPQLIWSRELQHRGIPPTVTTLRLHALTPLHTDPAYKHLLHIDPSTVHHPEPTALRELILDLHRDLHHWEDLLYVYGDQLVSVQFHIQSLFWVDMDGHLQLLARTCPRLRRLTITSDRFSSSLLPHFVFPPIVYLGLRVTRMQLPKQEFMVLFAFLEALRSSVPSLRVVRLLNEHNVRCLLKTHTKLAVRMLKPFMAAAPFRVEDKEGTLLTGLTNLVLGGHHELIHFGCGLDSLKALGYL